MKHCKSPNPKLCQGFTPGDPGIHGVQGPTRHDIIEGVSSLDFVRSHSLPPFGAALTHCENKKVLKTELPVFCPVKGNGWWS